VLRDALRWLAPALGVAAMVLFVWLSVNIPADHPVVGPTGWAALAGFVGGAVAVWLAWWAGKRKA